MPARIKAAFQTVLPATVSTLKRRIGIRIIPAGTETTLRASGTTLAKSTT